jgi:hypothetical protein
MPTKDPYVFNISSMQDFMQCRYRWVCKWVVNRVPRREAPALTQGKMLHLVFEDFLTGKFTMNEAFDHHIAQAREAVGAAYFPWEAESILKAIAGMEELREPMMLWHDKFEWEVPVLEVEQPFEIAHPMNPHYRIKGRPDRVGVMNGQLWHIQNRGLAASTNFAVYIDLAKRHYHEHVYAQALSEKYGMPYGGTMFNLVRKHKYRTNVGKKNEAVKSFDQMFYQYPMPIVLGGPLNKSVMMSILLHAEGMLETRDRYLEDGSMPPPNEKLNGGFSGNVIDPYFRVLTGEADLWDNTLFKQREDTYATEENNDAQAGA